jgi:predicted DsbA family dithiol-disulfide isomerase
MSNHVIEVFADVACPFTHVGLRRFQEHRRQLGVAEPVLRVRAWPLELVNGAALDGPSLTPKIEALRAAVAPGLFAGFDPSRFSSTTLPALASEAAAYCADPQAGEQFSLAVRHALFEDGLDVADEHVLQDLRRAVGVPSMGDDDMSTVEDDYAEGRRRGVVGSPHFFTATSDFFCPSLQIHHDDDGYRIQFDAAGFERFVAAAFAD